MKAKRLVSAVLATAMAFSCAVSASANGNGHNYGEYEPEVGEIMHGCYSYINGDANCDGTINVTDVSKIAAHVKGIKPITDFLEFAAADTDKNGIINTRDVVRVAAYVKGIKK